MDYIQINHATVRIDNGVANIPEDPFTKVRARFLERTSEQLATLKAIASNDQSFRASIGDGALLKTAHSLAGAGGIFGYPEISAAASGLEGQLIERSAEDVGNARRALDELIRELERCLGPMPSC